MITLYQVEWCPYCHRVREALTELGLGYETVDVPASRLARSEVIELSGQAKVPVIKDDDLVVADSARIVEYLEETYGHSSAYRSSPRAPSQSTPPYRAASRSPLGSPERR